MNPSVSTQPANPATAQSMMPSFLAAIVLLIGSSADALALFFRPGYTSNLLFVFVFAYLAYCFGLWIERRRAS